MAQVYAGSANLAAGSLSVTGNDTPWLLEAPNGGVFYSQGYSVPIDAVSGDAALTLAFGWPGPSQIGAAYRIMPTTDSSAALDQAVSNLNEVVRNMRAGMWMTPDGRGSAAGRAQYDGRQAGFIYLKVTATSYFISVKASDANADWGPYVELVGTRGQPGLPGTDGTNGVGNYYDPNIEIPGIPPAGEVYSYLFVRQTSFASGLVGAICKIGVAATGVPAVISVRKRTTIAAAGTQIGTITCGIGALTGTPAGTATTFDPGDIISFVMPTPQNATLSHLLITLAGQRN